MDNVNPNYIPPASRNLKVSRVYDNLVEIGKAYQYYEQLEQELILLTGYNLRRLKDLFAAGWTLTPPPESSSLTEALEKYGCNKRPWMVERKLED